MIKTRHVKIIHTTDWDILVSNTYKRPYSFQAQEHGRPRGFTEFSAPALYATDYSNKALPERLDNPDMGVNFKAWLAKDPKEAIEDGGTQWLEIWWERHFYPDFETVVNDLHRKGLLEEGDYAIKIDW